MTTIDARHATFPAPEGGGDDRPPWQRHKHQSHWRTSEAEFDGMKFGMWLFLATEVLLFGGLFCAYAVFRMLYPEAWSNGSHYLDWRFGCLNTIVLLYSSYTIAMSIHNAQRNQQGWLKINLAQTVVCALIFVWIKLQFEYIPKLSVGKAPGMWFSYPFAENPYEPIWWSVYYVATGIHATHVLIGVGLISWLLVRSYKNHFGPTHYAAVEITGLYWHIVDMIWIFLFPLLYLIH